MEFLETSDCTDGVPEGRNMSTIKDEGAIYQN